MLFIFLIFAVKVMQSTAVELDLINCGVDHEEEVTTGDVPLTQYPWSGILYYIHYGEVGETRAVMMVVLIHKEFVLAPAADVGPIANRQFRKNSRVLIGEDWESEGRRVRNYVLHPEYGDTYNTVALVQLKDAVTNIKIRPLCPPPEILRNPKLYVVKFADASGPIVFPMLCKYNNDVNSRNLFQFHASEDYNTLQKQVIEVDHIPGTWCKNFYIAANLYSLKMRPPHVACVLSLKYKFPCVWNSGSALVSRDVWGRWQLLGLGVRGPGCSAPSRYLDIMSYDPWIRSSLQKFKRLTISKISKQKYVLRSGSTAYQSFGDCDEEEKENLIFRESIVLRTDNFQYQFLTYNMSIIDNIDYTCLTLELVNASAVSEMRLLHHCRRQAFATPRQYCHSYKGTLFDVSVYLMFSDKCRFEMFAWGWPQTMVLLDPQKWKQEEGTYYKDFSMAPEEYRGQAYQTDFGFEPIDYKMWVPEYDIWTTTIMDNSTLPPTTPIPDKEAGPATIITPPWTRPPSSTTTTTTTKRTFKRKTTTTTTTGRTTTKHT